MKDASTGFRIGLYLCLSLLAGVCASAFVTVANKAGRALDNLSDALVQVKAIEVNTTRLEAEASGLLNASRQVVLAERKATDAQIKQIGQIGIQTTTLLEQATQTVKQANEAIKAFGNAGDQATVTLATASRSVNQVSQDTHALLVNATEAIDADTAKEALANVAVSTQNLAAATADAASSMATVRKGVEFEVRALMAPPRKVKWLAEETARMVGKFFGF